MCYGVLVCSGISTNRPMIHVLYDLKDIVDLTDVVVKPRSFKLKFKLMLGCFSIYE